LYAVQGRDARDEARGIDTTPRSLESARAGAGAWKNPFRERMTRMRLIYLSTDELNQSLVRAWCERRGIEVEFPLPKERARDVTHVGLLVDLDHTTPEWLGMLARWLDMLQHGTGHVAAHGSGSVADAFRRAFRTLPLTVTSRLCQEVLQEFASDLRAPGPEGLEDESSTLTWVNLA
jgi:hypothetical protein